jgi:hypothetical protein
LQRRGKVSNRIEQLHKAATIDDSFSASMEETNESIEKRRGMNEGAFEKDDSQRGSKVKGKGNGSPEAMQYAADGKVPKKKKRKRSKSKSNCC